MESLSGHVKIVRFKFDFNCTFMYYNTSEFFMYDMGWLYEELRYQTIIVKAVEH